MKMVPGTIPESMPLLVQEPIRVDDREVEDLTSWKPEVPFMAGSVEDPGRGNWHLLLNLYGIFRKRPVWG
jgi:hypothetical protein